MKAVFKVLEGPVEHEMIVIRDGESLTVGRENDADIPVNADQQMSSVHLSVECKDNRCVVTDLNSTNGTFINEKRLEGSAVVYEGDVVRCGVTRFEVEQAPGARDAGPPQGNVAEGSGGEPVSKSKTVSPGAAATNAAASAPAADEEFLQQLRGFLEETAAAVLNRFKLDDDLSTPDEFGRRLQSDPESLDDAIKFFAYALPKRLAVWWAAQCVRTAQPSPPPEDAAILQATEKWVAAPNESHRRKAMSLAEGQECQTAAAWTGVSAFWSHGSMAPPNVPAVPPKDEFTGKAVYGAVALAAVIGAPEEAPKRKAEFVDLAIAVASGENNWQEG